ncbi:hypothetical protein CYLTODRAFT_435459 [Cylindrobasidium torrendii FP15055 ss-10]|uniref:Splicing arginine serine-rich 12 n=1 Tax=Cylindrobasidium torrendii FP15055 ss-10 TaxID=1314674 RepID=A0A0D7BKC2_9AGAR|nr:hypothetical protein CYLTODRAFT_435459 [Cylindrobasidium torrendii FP15055 ss-10]
MAPRSRSRSVSPGRPHKRRRERSPSSDSDLLPYGARTIAEDDYFQKIDEFRIWLRNEKDKYFDELSGEKSRHYFRKFVKAWNRGKLSKKLYAGVDSSAVPTSYKWSFSGETSNDKSSSSRSRRDSARDEDRPRHSRVKGPTLPSASDLTLAREADADFRDEERKYQRKKDRKEAKERVEDMVGPKEVGREGMMEKKRAIRESNKAFGERGDDGLEADESTLMGGNDSFQAQLAKRDSAKKRFQQSMDEKDVALRERAIQLRDRESATLSMFQQMAKERFG